MEKPNPMTAAIVHFEGLIASGTSTTSVLKVIEALRSFEHTPARTRTAADIHETEEKIVSTQGFPAMRSAMLVNGGSCVAILGLLGSSLGTSLLSGAKSKESLLAALTWFAVGTITPVVGMGAAYFYTMFVDRDTDPYHRPSFGVPEVAFLIHLALTAFAFIAFGLGVSYAHAAITASVT